MRINHRPLKKRKYRRKCGFCGEINDQTDMTRNDQSPNGWMCEDCYRDAFEHQEILESLED